jgi:hypothetical protein
MRQGELDRAHFSWKRCLSALLTAGLLLNLAVVIPSSVYGIDFSQVNWVLDPLNTSNPSPFYSVTQTVSNSTDSQLTFILQSTASPYSGTKTETMTASSFAFFDGNGTTINATWAGLSKLTSSGGGTVVISITEQATSTNMFSQPSTSQPPDSPTITGANVGGVSWLNVQVMVQFTFTNWSTPVSSSGLTFTLDFHN